MKACAACDHENRNDAKFCVECGHKFGVVTTAAPAVGATPAAPHTPPTTPPITVSLDQASRETLAEAARAAREGAQQITQAAEQIGQAARHAADETHHVADEAHEAHKDEPKKKSLLRRIWNSGKLKK